MKTLSVHKHLLLVIALLVYALQGRAWPQQEGQPLPEIQNQEYTIVGLEKIVLPQKQRLHLTRPVALRWSAFNHRLAKPPVQSFFPFSHFKPVFLRKSTYPVLRVYAGGGSFTTLQAGVFAQKHFANATPFVDFRWRNSDGHTAQAGWLQLEGRGGVDVPLPRGGLFSTTGALTVAQQELWASRLVAWHRVRFDRQHLSGQLRWSQPWNDRWYTNLSTQLNSHLLKRVFQTRQTGFRSRAELQFRSGNLSLWGQGSFWQVTTHRQRLRLPLDGQLPARGKQTHRLWSGGILAGGRSGVLGLKLGIVFQKLEPETGGTENRVLGRADVFLQLSQQATLFLRYRPGYDFLPLQDLLEEHRASDLLVYQATRYRHRVSGGVDLRTRYHLRARASVSFLEADRYPALQYGLGSLVVADTLPLWLYRYLPRVKLWRYSAQADWEVVGRLQAMVLVSYWKSKLNGTDEQSRPVRDAQLPNLPNLSGQATLRVYFARSSWLETSLHYTGRRYQDLANQNRLRAFLLLNARLHLALLPHFAVRFYGENLTDRRYQLYSEYVAPGVAAGGRLIFTF